MSRTTTLEQVEQMAAQLPLTDQLKLAAHICEKLSLALPAMPSPSPDKALNWLSICDEVAEQIGGEFDSVSDLHQIREERMAQIE